MGEDGEREVDDEDQGDCGVQKVGQERRFQPSDGRIQNNCAILVSIVACDCYGPILPPKGIKMVAATKFMPETPLISWEPVKIIDAQPKTLFVKFKIM